MAGKDRTGTEEGLYQCQGSAEQNHLLVKVSDLPKVCCNYSVLTHQKLLKVKINADFLSLVTTTTMLQTETVEPIRKLLINDASSNFYIQLGHIGSLPYNCVTNFCICIFHLQHQKYQPIKSADAYDWAQTQVECWNECESLLHFITFGSAI